MLQILLYQKTCKIQLLNPQIENQETKCPKINQTLKKPTITLLFKLCQRIDIV